jgi:hypothetical protein
VGDKLTHVPNSCYNEKDIEGGTMKVGIFKLTGNNKSMRGKFVEIICPLCEKTKFMRGDHIKKAKSCGCKSFANLPKEGEKYGMLTTTGKHGKNSDGRTTVECECECGSKRFYKYTDIKRSKTKTKSCGCYRPIKTHGMTGTSVYSTWEHIKRRCNNPKNHKYHRYGGRGITYDKKWETFEGFYEDMGSTYKEGLQIDRIDNDGNYTKENCEWVNNIKNQQHKSTTYELHLPNGDISSLKSFCKFHKIPNYVGVCESIRNGEISVEGFQNKYN